MKNLCFILISTLVFSSHTAFSAWDTENNNAKQALMMSQPTDYSALNFDYLIGKLDGIDDEVLKMHFKLYEGYVKNTNKLLKQLKSLSEAGKGRTPEYAGLKHMLGWEFDGMRLHEYYFENLEKKGSLDSNSDLGIAIKRDFGSIENWQQDFIDTGMMRGIGWVVLYLDPKSGKLINAWINEHDLGHLSGATPLLIMDVFEHAYITQYGLNRAGYIDAFLKNVNWEVVNKRFSKS